MRIPLLSKIFFAIAALLMAGGLFTRLIFSGWDVASLFFVSSAGVCLAISILLNLEGYYTLFRPRSVRRSLRAFGYVLALIAVVAGVNYGASYYPEKLDLSGAEQQTISNFSKNIAKGFTDEVEILYLQLPDAQSHYADEQVRRAVKMYQDENPRIKFTKLNIMQHPELVEKYQLNSQEQAMFAIYKDHRERFYKTDENSITQALLRLQKGRKSIYFSVGHGEIKTDDENARGFSSLKKEIQRLFYDVIDINLDNEVIPEDAAAIVILGPTKNFGERVYPKLKDYLDKKGRVFLAFDPIQNPDNGQFLKNFGLKIPMGIVHQEESAMANVGSIVVSGQLPEKATHPILNDLGKESPVNFYVTSAISEISESSSQDATGSTAAYTMTPLMVSAPTTLLRAGYTKQDKVITKGSFNLMVSARNAAGGELFVSGDSDLFANQFLYQHSNPSLMFNLFSYLTKDEDIIKATSPVATSKDFFVTDVKFKIYAGVFILPLPLLLFSLGGFMWFRRRWL